MPRSAVAVTVAVLFSICGGTPAIGQSGTISGVVVNDQIAPVAGASVSYETSGMMLTPSGALVPDPAHVHGAVTAGADGRFVISSVPAGAYTLCAYGAIPSQLSQCQWVNRGTHVNLELGQSVSGVLCQISEGTLFVFTISDHQGQIRDLVDSAGLGRGIPLTGANFSVGGFVGSRYVPANLVSNSGGVRQYVLAVPKTASLAPFFGTALKVTDAQGAAIAVGAPNTQISANSAAQVARSFVVP